MKNKIIYKRLIGLIFLLTLNLCGIMSAQVTHDVTVSNFQFSPANLVIAVGDFVKWTNTDGLHSVDGSQATFPSNPESFGNSIGSGWVYTFGFTIEGVYNYQCSEHGSGMSGKITVGSATGMQDNSAVNSSVHAFPNPASEILYIPVSEKNSIPNGNLKLNIYNLSGKCFTSNVPVNDNAIPVNINELREGLYFFELSDNEKIVSSGKFVKNQ